MNRPKRAPLDREALMQYALRALSSRALTVSELREKMRRRAATPSDVDEVIARVKDLGFLDDSRFAEAFAAARKDNQGFGRMRVARDLRRRRVAQGIAEKAVDRAFEGVDETAMIEQYLARKYRSTNLGEYLTEPKNLASAYRRLRMAGFSSSASIAVLKRYAAQAEELQESEDDSLGQ